MKPDQIEIDRLRREVSNSPLAFSNRLCLPEPQAAPLKAERDILKNDRGLRVRLWA
jgi:hypothetical protein